jgi:GH15 family glucan-1,4-alpha-glucosidase
VTEDGWRFLTSLVDAACAKWKEPDRGIWEMRGQPRHFVQSKVMCWVAVERGLELAKERKLACDGRRWRAVRDEMRASIERDGVDPGRGCFVQSFGSREVDASLLLLPLVGFVDAKDPRMLATTEAIEKDLCENGLVRRYRTEHADDGLHGDEGVFLMTSFWLVDVFAMQGRREEAESLFERLLGLGNDVGLFAEEYDLSRKELLGNFPQAFTHMALINSAGQLRRLRSEVDPALPIAERDHVHPGRRVARKTLHHSPARKSRRRVAGRRAERRRRTG